MAQSPFIRPPDTPMQGHTSSAEPPSISRDAGRTSQPECKRPFAWQPLTPRGVAAFASASFKRLFLLQFICAAIVTGGVIWFVEQAWLPTVFEAIRQMPSEGEIRAARLDWHGESPQRLAEGRFIAFAVDVKNEGHARSPAQIEVLFGQKQFKVFSLFGYVQSDYSREWRIAFNRPELEAWWGAWSPAVYAGMSVSLLVGLLLIWGCLATIYFLPIWLAGLFMNRQLTVGGSWRLAGAALMPGALFLAGTIILYGMGQVDLVRLLLAAIGHVVIGWVYIVVAVRKCPFQTASAGEKQNPFSRTGD